jgi:hypothetical protein
MSHKPETVFIASVHKYVKCYHMKNNNLYNAGIPDCWYSGPIRDAWIEYKFVVLPKQDKTIIEPNLSPLQFNWLADRFKEGRNVLVLIGSKLGGVWLHRDDWEIGMTKLEYNACLQTRPQIAAYIDRMCGC